MSFKEEIEQLKETFQQTKDKGKALGDKYAEEGKNIGNEYKEKGKEVGKQFKDLSGGLKDRFKSVSYTHLDVYKRQVYAGASDSFCSQSKQDQWVCRYSFGEIPCFFLKRKLK
uniref:Uncharacterized protein n=2 Tax=Candidatus Enterococcus clewellii TaxID=1834193 RepID=A0A242K4X5_9ENTE|nr:hypothetical protein [Enterococcus sp. 9E7_DIV0242]OTP14382.1 hypothetical protein A5888_002483 [Enterococcus sp. 9E7_DIV0242]